jgi:hypothetical protein
LALWVFSSVDVPSFLRNSACVANSQYLLHHTARNRPGVCHGPDHLACLLALVTSQQARKLHVASAMRTTPPAIQSFCDRLLGLANTIPGGLYSVSSFSDCRQMQKVSSCSYNFLEVFDKPCWHLAPGLAPFLTIWVTLE